MQLPCFPVKVFKIDDAPINASLIFWYCFAEMICSVSWNSPMRDNQNIWLTREHPEPIGTILTLAYGPTQKSPPSLQAVFQVAPAPISSRFLYPPPPLLLGAPNQNRQATQASVYSNNKDYSATNGSTMNIELPAITLRFSICHFCCTITLGKKSHNLLNTLKAAI